MSEKRLRTDGHAVVWWRGLLRALGLTTGIVAAAGTSAFAANAQDYRSAAVAPVAWQVFTKDLLSRFQERLQGEDETASRFREDGAKHQDKSPDTVTVRAWITPAGKVERLEIGGLDDHNGAITLRTLLASVTVNPPPSDLLQPLHLRLSLRAIEAPPEKQ